jgi:hypothetical protein
MAEEPKDKGVEEKQPQRRKPPGYAKFEKLLKRVVTVPPVPKAPEIIEK